MGTPKAYKLKYLHISRIEEEQGRYCAGMGYAFFNVKGVFVAIRIHLLICGLFLVYCTLLFRGGILNMGMEYCI